MAARLLREELRAVDAAIRRIEALLFGARTKQRYVAVAQQIARQRQGRKRGNALACELRSEHDDYRLRKWRRRRQDSETPRRTPVP